MKIDKYEIRKVVKWGQGKVVFLTKEITECMMKEHVIVTVEKEKGEKVIKIRNFQLKG